MTIHIKMAVKHNYAIIKYFKSYFAVIILVIKKGGKKIKKKKKVLDYSTIFHPKRIRLYNPS